MTGSRKRLVIVSVILLGLVLNGTFWLLTSRESGGGTLLTPTSVETDGLVAAVGTADGGVITASRDNQVVTHNAALSSTAAAQVEETVGAIASLADGSVLVGTANGRVITYSHDLEPGSIRTVNGRVLALAPASDGFYVAHGVGAFGIRFYISFFGADDGEAAVTYQIAQPVTSMAPWLDGVVFGTANSNVGYFTSASPEEPVWMTQLNAPISRVASSPGLEGVLAGSDKGNVTMLAPDGAEAWSTSIGAYPVRGLNYDPGTGDVLVGDANGRFTELSATGATVYTAAVSQGSDLEAIIPGSESAWLVVPRSGTWQALDPSAASSASSASTLRLAWAIGNGIYALLLTGAIVAVIDPYRKVATRTMRRAWKARIAYLFALPAVALIALFSYYPAAMAIYYSFTNYSLRSITEWVGFDNYQNILFDDPYFRVGIKNMLIITVTSVIKTLTVPLLIAELIFWLRNSWHSYIFRTLFILPTVVPGLVFTLMWRQIYDPDTGLINELLGVLGLDNLQTAWLGNPETALWAIIGVGFPWVDAFALLILLGGLLNINSELFDAAKVDGASVWQRFRNIDLPLLVPQFRILLFFAIAGTVQGFVSIFILTRGGPGMTTYIPSLQMYMRIADGDFGYASAVGVILFLFILVATFVVLRLRRNDGVEDA
ncbi:MAG: sugar ABC transporter permease [Chloroflexota bacterium]|nr:sugar ABC transporter permease [Chloroflexota bacterium]